MAEPSQERGAGGRCVERVLVRLFIRFLTRDWRTAPCSCRCCIESSAVTVVNRACRAGVRSVSYSLCSVHRCMLNHSP